MGLIFVYITNPSKAEARRIAFHLIKKKLAACVNIYDNVNSIYMENQDSPVQAEQSSTMYPRKGKIADEKECILIIKTDAQNYKKIVAEVEKIHSYTIPCIVKIPISANKKYEKWLRSCLKNK